MEAFIEALARKSAAVREEGDYELDGLLYCGKCGTKKQCRVNLFGKTRIVGCQCQCAIEREEEEKARQRREEERLRIDSLRLSGIADKGLRRCRFEEAADSALIRKCRSYAERWEDMRAENVGLLLWGDTGSGKTYAAACVANALIDRGVPAMITGFPRILAADWQERAELLRQIGTMPLLVLDDLGAERETGMSLETVYAVIDERNKSGKPLIVTTNLPLQALKEPRDMAHRRIYDRVLAMCTPVMAETASYRSQEAARKRSLIRELVARPSPG